jgi:hypothetical protein
MPNVEPIKLLDVITGSDFLMIQSALSVAPKSIDLSDAIIHLVRQKLDQTLIVQLGKAGTTSGSLLCIRDNSVAELATQEFEVLIGAGSVERTVQKISGTSFLAIQVALAVYLNRSPNTVLADFNIKVLAMGPSTAVIFKHKDTPVGARGGRGFEVELCSESRSVIASNFLR